MIKFVPVSSDKLFKPYSSEENCFGYIGYDMSNGNSVCGKCVFRLNGYSMDVCYVQALNDDAETEEGLIRSALNFGANRNVYIAYYKADNAVKVAELLGFEEDESGALSGDIPSLLKGSCCKGKQGDK